jgi:CheY-like chemotaxis protein
VLQREGAVCERTDPDGLQGGTTCDLVVLRLGGSLVPPAEERALVESCRCPVLVIGGEAAVESAAQSQRKMAMGFALEGCTAAEVRLRAAMLLARWGGSHKRTVVVADDDRVTRGMIEKWLVKEGFTCHVAGDGQQALELIREVKPAAVILDIYMPRRNGFAVLREIREDASIADTRVLMLTGSAEQEDVRRASTLHANGYLVKPFQAAKLVERIRAMLATAH